jgi:hypothetical protein
VENLSDARLTLTGTLAGTPAYMSPEQVRRHQVDFRADLFAFGVLVYEMTSGSNPFEAETTTATIAGILERDPPPLSEPPSPGLRALDRIVAICLRKRAEERYASTQELVADLERIQAGLLELRDHGSSPREAADPGVEARRSTAQWWWEFHQVAVSTVYALMIYPAWRARVWLQAPWGMLFFFAVLAAAATSITVRLHLRFTARVYPTELPRQRARAQPWTRWSDAGFSVALLLEGLGIGDAHTEVAALLVTVAIAAAVASFTIETATTRAAFGEVPQRRGG